MWRNEERILLSSPSVHTPRENENTAFFSFPALIYIVFGRLDFFRVFDTNVFVDKLLAPEWLCADLAAPLCSFILLCFALHELEDAPVKRKTSWDSR